LIGSEGDIQISVRLLLLKLAARLDE